MAVFDLKKARIRRALLLEKLISENVVHGIVFAAFLIMAGLLVWWLWATPGSLNDARIFGMLLIVSSLAFAFWTYSLFFETCLDEVPVPEDSEGNLANFLDFEAAKVVEKYLNGSQQDLSALLLPIMQMPGAAFIWYRMGINPKTVEAALQEYLKVPREPATGSVMVLFLEDALVDLKKIGVRRLLNWRDLLVTLSSNSEFLRKYLFDRKLEKKDMRELADWQQGLEDQIENAKKFWLKENLTRTKGIGKDWASGYTVNLDNYARDVTRIIAKRGFASHLFGRKDVTEAIERILARSGENNVILVGEEGVGKKTIVHALAKNILEGQTLPQLAHKRVLELDIGAILAGSVTEHEIEGRMKIVLNEALRAGNVILLIDEIHSLFQRTPGAGAINATELLLPYLSSHAIQIIGLTTHAGYQETIARNSSLLKNFEKVEVHEPDKDNVVRILHEIVPELEAHSQVLILHQAIKRAVELTDRYIKMVPFPEKAITVLQEAAVFAQTKEKSPIVTPEHVEEVVHQKTEIPVGKIALAETEVLLELEKVLHRKVIGQDEAITAVANALRRARSGIASEKKPIGNFLFLGPTGVGKTETAKALAEVYFGSEKHMLRFDMSEYQKADSIDRLIGRDDHGGQLTNAVMQAPFSLLLFDELEKAHADILNLFLQVFDDGRLTDALGRTVDFTNTIIICTSNAGAELIRESVQQFREVNLKERLLDYLQKQGIFRPEFLNRFDAVITFRPLTVEQTVDVVELLLKDLNRRLQPKDIQVDVTPGLMKKIAEIGYDPQFGARPLRRVIQDRLETVIARKLLSGEYKRGDKLIVTPEEIDIPVREPEPPAEKIK